MDWTWTWSGQCFGYWMGNDLWTYSGRHVGHRAGDEIFSPTGRYLGEVMQNGRLVTNKAKAGHTGNTFKPRAARTPRPIQAGMSALTIYKGYQDFPHPDLL
ncbi:MAG TPA: hypothetical protein VHP13_05120 [Gammaproteobacteria bacterium]|jgi:hypothetical protein|nr:hypothetical protein [Gammaproteobacteria bacterium]